MAMNLLDKDLLPGEQLIATKFANMVISVRENGLSRFAFDDYMKFVGMKGKESIGGKAYLTNYRIIFKSHFFNRVRGKHSIFLPNIINISATVNSLIIETPTQQFEFIMWFKKEFIDLVNQNKAQINSADIDMLKKSVLSCPEAVGDGLKKWVTLEVINQICLNIRKPMPNLESLSGSEANDFLEILELFTD